MRHHLRNNLGHVILGLVCFWLGYQSYTPDVVQQLPLPTEEPAKQVVVERKYICPSNTFTDSTFAKSSYSRNLNIPITKDPKLFAAEVTLISFCDDKDSLEYVQEAVKVYPGIKTFIAATEVANPTITKMLGSSSKIVHIGMFKEKALALNKLISSVKTKYFLHLDSFHRLEPFSSNHSVGWLLHGLMQVPALDVIGGSVIVGSAHRQQYDVLEVPCYRLKHYNYTYGESYEYKASIGDIMICERTSSSFLAKTAAFKNKMPFDARVGRFIFEDFFLMAKKRGIRVGTKPEVYFSINGGDKNKPSALQHVSTAFIADLIPFGLKHQVMTIIDIDQNILYICERFSTIGGKLFPQEAILCDYDKARPYWKMGHWAYNGMSAPPTMMIALKRSMRIVGDYFNTKTSWNWYVIGGGILGGVKCKGFLPWEAGDIDIWISLTYEQLLADLRSNFLKTHKNFELALYPKYEIVIKPKRGFGGHFTIFVKKKAEKIVRMNMDGYWVPASYEVFEALRLWFTAKYLQHESYNRKTIKCKEKSNTCLAEFKTIFDGRVGFFKELFTENWREKIKL